VFDNASNLLTNLLSGGSLGNMPIAEGAVTDLFDRPLFFSLYDWFLEVFDLFHLDFEFQLTVCLVDLFEFRRAYENNL
jgi:cytochrome P450 family 97 subfamily B polypeptide 3